MFATWPTPCILFCMLSAFLVSYYLQQFQVPISVPYRPDATPRYFQSVQPRGRLTVEAQSAKTASVPPGSQRVEMLRLRLTADCSGNVTMTNIRLQRRGLGFNEDIESVYAVHRGSRISRAMSVSNRDGTVDLNIRGFTLPACEGEDVIILADVSPDASIASEHRFELLGIDANGSTVRIDKRIGDFTRVLNTAGPAVGRVSVDYLTVNQRVRFGSRQVVQRFTLEADAESDQRINAITFTNRGSASDDDLQNLFVDFRNRPVTTIVPSMNEDSVRLVFDPPFTLPSGSTLKFLLRADVRASRSRTIRFVVEEEADIEARPLRGRES